MARFTDRGGGFWEAAAAIATGLVSGACAFDGSADATTDPIAQNRQAVLGVDTFLYFRSNASGFGVDSANRLRPTFSPTTFKATFPVMESWMVTSGDNALFTETNQRDGWGTAQQFYGSSVNPVLVPGGGALQGSSAFIAKYPSLGTFQVSFDSAQNSFQIQQAPAARAWEPSPTDAAAISTIGVMPQNVNQMVVGYTNGDIFLTFNAFATPPNWLKIDAVDQPNIPVASIAIGPGDGQTIYAAFVGTQQGRKLWRFGGQFWTELSTIPTLPIVTVSVNPLQPSRVYVLAEGGAIASSDNFGDTWTTPPLPDPVLDPPLLPGSRITTVTASHPTTPNQVWVGTSTGDIFVTFDAAQTWGEFGSASMPARPVSRITINPRGLQPPEVWATFQGLNGESIWLTSNGGQVWVNRHNPNLPTTSIPVSALALYGASINPIDDSVLYVNDSFGTASRTEDRGLTWVRRTD